MQLKVFNTYMKRCKAIGHTPDVKEAKLFENKYDKEARNMCYTGKCIHEDRNGECNGINYEKECPVILQELGDTNWKFYWKEGDDRNSDTSINSKKKHYKKINE